MATGHAMLINLHHLNNANINAMASFATDSIIIIHAKVRNYKHWKYSYYTVHAKKVELEYLANIRLCARCLIFILHFSYFLNRYLMGYLHVGRWGDFDVLK